MKKIILPLIVLAFIACNSDNSTEASGDTNKTIVADFLTNVESFEAIEEKAPISYFAKLANDIAEETATVTKDNIQDVLDAAKHYGKCIIIVGDHTIVKIDNVEDCKQSGSWGACMPMAKGYIKRGDLDYQEDYINNIIGTPDSQERTAYLFK